MYRVGIFAGTFDPIHDGHLAVARSASQQLELDALYFMVEAEPWSLKKPIARHHREKMVSIAINESQKLKLIKYPDRRFDLTTTLPKLEEQFVGAELYFVFGGDVFIQMNNRNWPGIEHLLKHYVVIFERREISEREITAHAKKLGIVVAIIPSEHPNHSSSDVRLKPHEKQIWVPKAVASYMEAHNLY